MKKLYHQHTLSNGLRVVYVPFKGVYSLTYRLIGRAGGGWETMNQHGVAHFLEHVVFEGSKKYPSAKKLSNVISDVGGWNNGYTSYDYVSYVAKTLSEDLDRGLDYLSQLVTEPLLKPSDILKHRQIIAQELKSALDVPLKKFMMNSIKIDAHNTSRYHYPLIGTLNDINKVTKKDLVHYIIQNYGAKNFILTVCGDINKVDLFNKAEKYFSKMNSGSKNEFPDFLPNTEENIYVDTNPNVDQTTLVLTFEAPSKLDLNKYKASLMSRILGVGDTSRLFTKIRQENGLAYAVGSVFSTNVHTGKINIHAQVEEKNLQKVVELIKAELNKIQKRKVSNDEFMRSKKQVLASLAFDQEDPEEMADYVSFELNSVGEAIPLDEILDKYNKITQDEIKDISREIFSKEPKIKLLTKSKTAADILDYWNSK